MEADPVDKIVLANIPAWLKPAYEAICQRDNPLEVREVEQLGLSTAVLLAKVREALRGNRDLQEAILRKSEVSLWDVTSTPISMAVSRSPVGPSSSPSPFQPPKSERDPSYDDLWSKTLRGRSLRCTSKPRSPTT
jgi:hypothetical protein